MLSEIGSWPSPPLRSERRKDRAGDTSVGAPSRVLNCLRLSHCYGSLSFSTRRNAVPKFTVLSRVDAYVDYTTEIEADSAEEAVDLVYEGHVAVEWTNNGVVEFDAVRMSAVSADGEDIDGYTRGKG